MSGTASKGLSETYERYAAGLARAETLAPAAPPANGRAAWHARLAAAGVRGVPERRTFWTGDLPPGCVPCLEGRGSNVCLTTLCNRNCFFCLNPKPRLDEMSVHGRTAAMGGAASLLREIGAASVGVSGGEPLLFPRRALGLVRRLRRDLGGEVRIDLYTNGDRLDAGMAARLARAGADGVRVNVAARDYDLAPIRAAAGRIRHVAAEIPAVPSDLERLLGLVEDLEAAGAHHLILHELFASAHNLDAMRERGLRAAPRDVSRLCWSPVAGSEGAAFEVLLRAAARPRRLGVYYCSTGTQDWIAERALARRRR